MIHRHLSLPARPIRAERLPSAAVADLLDRGDLDAWRPIAAAIRLHPHGRFAERVRRLLDAYPMYGTSPLWRAWIDRCRIRAEAGPRSMDRVDLAALRRRRRLSQAVTAARIGMSQSDLSKFERRADVRLSSLRAYAEALGGRVETVFMSKDGRIQLRIGRSLSRPKSVRRPKKRAKGS